MVQLGQLLMVNWALGQSFGMGKMSFFFPVPDSKSQYLESQLLHRKMSAAVPVVCSGQVPFSKVRTVSRVQGPSHVRRGAIHGGSGCPDVTSGWDEPHHPVERDSR